MDLAVVLYFDSKSENIIYNIQEKVCKNGVNDYIIDNKIPPHITMSIFTISDINEVIDAVEKFADNIIQSEISLTSIGLFNTKPSVIYLAPVVSDYLINAQKSIQSMLTGIVQSFDPYYLSANWVPHCAIAVKLDDNELHNALTVISNEFTPLTCNIERIAIAKCCVFKEIKAWDIKK